MLNTQWHEIYPPQPRTVNGGTKRTQITTKLYTFPPRLPGYEAHHIEYWEGHGISWYFAQYLYNVYPSARGIVFCLSGGGGWQLRVTKPGETHRFDSSVGESRSAIFVPHVKISDDTGRFRVFVCEGPADAVAIREQGYCSVATLGSAITPERVQAIQHVFGDSLMYYVMDRDRAGWSGYSRFQSFVGGCAKPARLPGSVKDFCEVGGDERAALLRFWTEAENG